MTTIATNGRALAGDRRGTTNQGALLTDLETKIFIEGGSAWGFAGEWWAWQKFLPWVREDMPEDKKPELPESFEALQLAADGRVFYWDKHLVPERRDPPCAIGSGWPFAVGAMKAGATAREAVEVAITCDVYSGGDVDMVTIADIRAATLQAAE